MASATETEEVSCTAAGDHRPLLCAQSRLVQKPEWIRQPHVEGVVSPKQHVLHAVPLDKEFDHARIEDSYVEVQIPQILGWQLVDVAPQLGAMLEGIVGPRGIEAEIATTMDQDHPEARVPLENTGEDPDHVIFASLSRMTGLARLTALEIVLKISLSQFEARGTSINYTAKRRPMALAEAGDGENFTKCVS